MSETLSIVIPTFNEEANIERAYERLRSVLDGLGIDVGADLQRGSVD